MDSEASPKKREFTLAGIGEILWDELPEGRRLGGAPTNFAFHAHLQGARSFVISRVGKDSDGREILKKLERAGLTTDFISVDREHPTGHVTVSLDSQGIPEYTIHEGVAWDYLELSSPLLDLAQTIDAVSFGSLAQRSVFSRAAVFTFLGATPKDCLRLFDINLRQNYYSADILNTSLKLANVLKINQEELSVLAKLFRLKGRTGKCLQQLRNRFDLNLVALTRGAEGSLLLTQEGTFDFPGVAVSVQDTVGAGDAFGAALVLGMLQRLVPDELNEKANRLASQVCTQSGAWLSTEDFGQEMNI